MSFGDISSLYLQVPVITYVIFCHCLELVCVILLYYHIHVRDFSLQGAGCLTKKA